jgi:hypothetical protein
MDINEFPDTKFRYMMLSRLQSDCKYFIQTMPCVKYLHQPTVDEQIKLMKELWRALPEKPEWLTLEEIEAYEIEMKRVDIPFMACDAGGGISVYNKHDEDPYRPENTNRVHIPKPIDRTLKDRLCEWWKHNGHDDSATFEHQGKVLTRDMVQAVLNWFHRNAWRGDQIYLPY